MTTTTTFLANERIVLAHGGGGEMMGRLLHDHVLRALGNETLNALTDGAVLRCDASRIVFTTDSFVVQPLEFPGGDIGRLAVCGTVNDLAVMGGRPLGLSLALILEEGLEVDRLDRVLASISRTADEAGVAVVTGDTKVIERGSGTGMLINTAGVAELDDRARLGFDRIRPGDSVLINGTIGDHGMAIVSVRNGLEFETTLRSDAAPLNGLVQRLLDEGLDLHFLRDATRGGIAGVLADLSERTGLGVEIYEGRIPRDGTVRAAADMMGFDLLSVANEGKMIVVLPVEEAERALTVMRSHPLGERGARIGCVVSAELPLVELVTEAGGRRIVPRPYGEELPRIC